MKDQVLNPNSLNLSAGYFLEQYWDDRETLDQGRFNWKYNCIYQLRPKSMRGLRHILHLNSMQTNHVQRPGGIMHSPSSPKDSFTIVVFEACADKVCYGELKLKTGDIIFFDDTYTYNFINNGDIEFTAVTIEKSRLGVLLPTLSKAINHRIHDTDARFASTLNKIRKEFTPPSATDKQPHHFQAAEDEILAVIMTLLDEQTPTIPKLTAGEKIALEIRNQVFHHMDGDINIHSLAEQHHISEQTLQNSFKSLFGFTPKLFIRTLKLNHAHQELVKSTLRQTTVSKVAYKWGFTHLGRFSAYYTQLFEQAPSQTLKTVYCAAEENIKESCADRQEEVI